MTLRLVAVGTGSAAGQSLLSGPVEIKEPPQEWGVETMAGAVEAPSAAAGDASPQDCPAQRARHTARAGSGRSSASASSASIASAGEGKRVRPAWRPEGSEE